VLVPKCRANITLEEEAGNVGFLILTGLSSESPLALRAGCFFLEDGPGFSCV